MPRPSAHRARNPNSQKWETLASLSPLHSPVSSLPCHLASRSTLHCIPAGERLTAEQWLSESQSHISTLNVHFSSSPSVLLSASHGLESWSPPVLAVVPLPHRRRRPLSHSHSLTGSPSPSGESGPCLQASVHCLSHSHNQGFFLKKRVDHVTEPKIS